MSKATAAIQWLKDKTEPVKNATKYQTIKTRDAIKNLHAESLIDLFHQLSDELNKGKQNLTGEAFFNAAEKLLNQQMQYNNILATRLAEALEDIEVLKSRISELEKNV